MKRVYGISRSCKYGDNQQARPTHSKHWLRSNNIDIQGRQIIEKHKTCGGKRLETKCEKVRKSSEVGYAKHLMVDIYRI